MRNQVDFFEHVAHFNGNMPSSVQEVFWTRASKSKNIDVLTALIERKDASDFILKQAAARKEIKTKVAFLSRESMTNEERLKYLENETRAGVYVDLVNNIARDLDSNVFKKIQKVFTDKPTVTLAEALVNSPSTPPFLLVNCLSFLSSNTSVFKSDEFSRVFQKKLKETANNKDFFEILVQEFSESNKFFPVIFDYPSVDFDANFSAILNKYSVTFKDILKKVSSLAASNHSYPLRRYSPTSSEDFLSSLVGKILNNLPPADIIDYIKNDPELCRNVSQRTYDLVEMYNPDANELEKERLTGLREQALTEENETVLWELLSENDTQIFENILKNRNLPESIVSEAAQQLMDARHEPSQLYDFLRSFPTYTEPMLTAYYFYPKELVELDNWSFFEDPAEAKKKLFSMFSLSSANSKVRRRSYGHYNLGALIETMDASDPALLEVPWDVYKSTFSGWSRFDTSKITEMLLDYQNKIFGTSLDLWDSFEVLSHNYEGSLKDLVDTVKKMF